MPSPLVSVTSHPGANGSARCDGGVAVSCSSECSASAPRANSTAMQPVYNSFMKFILTALLAALALHAADVNTFSIVAYDPTTGDCGVTVASKYFSVGAVVPWGEAGVGCVATQANVNVGYGPRGLELLRQGLSAKEVIDKLLAEDKFPPTDGRQVAVVDAKGNIAAYTGPNAL